MKILVEAFSKFGKKNESSNETYHTNANGNGHSTNNYKRDAHKWNQLLHLANAVKREVVETLRKVVNVITQYAGNALPLESRNVVRGFILSLPSRWVINIKQ